MLMEIDISNSISQYLEKTTKAATLAVFRILFGSLMFVSMVRFWYNGWIEKLYINPSFHFKYYCFEWVSISDSYVYLLFILCGISALAVCVGYRYRVAIVIFFLSFTYIELLDKTTYLNHYYFISLISFMLIWLPAHSCFSMDSHRDKQLRSTEVPRWTVDFLKIMIGILYVYAGIAKLNPDWMLNAKPLSIWLSTKTDFYLIGHLFEKSWVHYFFSWGGTIYDLFIVFFLIWKRTRIMAFCAVLFFHIMTWLLFPIGMFPWIMICSSLIFFSAEFHQKIIHQISRALRIYKRSSESNSAYSFKNNYSFLTLSIFLIIQIIFPFRHYLFTDNIYWTEQGYRYSWRVMLMEKTGYANFKIVDTITQKRFYVENNDFLTTMQEKQMSTQPDFILEYAQHLGKHFTAQGHQNVAVYVENFVSLNGRPSQQYVKPDINLLTVDYPTLCNDHITAFKK